MKIYAIKASVKLLRDVDFIEGYGVIANFIDGILCETEQYRDFHQGKSFKPYCFSNFSPVDSSKTYRRGGNYTFILRTIDETLAAYLNERMVAADHEIINCHFTKPWIIGKKYIESLYNLTPLIITLQGGGYWRGQISPQDYGKVLFNNLVKKYNYFKQIKIEENFDIIEEIRFLNRKPVSFPYKDGINLLGDKIEIKISSNSIAQEIAYMTLGTGLGEMCARGAGFANYNFLKGGE